MLISILIVVFGRAQTDQCQLVYPLTASVLFLHVRTGSRCSFFGVLFLVALQSKVSGPKKHPFQLVVALFLPVLPLEWHYRLASGECRFLPQVMFTFDC